MVAAASAIQCVTVEEASKELLREPPELPARVAARAVSAEPAPCEHPDFVPKDTVDPDMANVCGACASDVSGASTIVSQPDVSDGSFTRCPVSGVTFRVEPHRPMVRHGGQHFRFCCAGCAKKFEENPMLFLRAECGS